VRAPTPTMPARKRRDEHPRRFLDGNFSSLLSQPHSTAPPSAERYGKRYERRFLSGEASNPLRFAY
jgi:hypothetical protein